LAGLDRCSPATYEAIKSELSIRNLDMAAQLALASSGITMPVSCASFPAKSATRVTVGWMSLKAGAFLHTFNDYPWSQIPASFTLDRVVKDID
jgi:hypothetical protein